MATVNTNLGRFYSALLLGSTFCAGVPAFAACEDLAPSPSCGAAPSALFTPDGTLWVSFVDAGHVWLSRSTDQGRSFSTASRVNTEPEKIYADGENRPVIGMGRDDTLFVAWTRDTEAAYSGDIRFTRSRDGGASFEAVRTINDDGLLTSHRFVALRTARDGTLYLAWLDKRDQVAALAEGKNYAGAALYYTLSTDNGASFLPNRKVADHSCECCRIALADADDGAVQAFWRHLFEDGAVRDHAIVRLDRAGDAQLQRATQDDWRIEGCPHHGPALQASETGWHLAWFSNGKRQRGVLYGHFDKATGSTQGVQTLDAQPAGGHPAILAQGKQLWVVWKRFDGRHMQLMLSQSSDAGTSWSTPRALLQTSGAADHPQLLAEGRQAWLAWHTADEGYRLLPLDPAPPATAGD